MNKIFKVIWNNAKHCYVVASELAKSYSRGGGSRSIRRAAIVLSVAAAVYAATGSALAANGGGDLDQNTGDYIGHSPYNVTIDSDVAGFVYGHKADSENVEEANVTMTGGSVGTVYGGYSNTGNAASNSVTISGNSTINHDVNGGYSDSGNAASNSVTISKNSTINGAVFGGHSSGAANSNSVTISENSTINIGNPIDIRGIYGGYSDFGNAASNNVNINGGTINRIVYGGYSVSGSAASNSVIIREGTISKDVYGGFSNAFSTDKGTATNNSVTIMENSTINGEVLGGYCTGAAASNSVTISGNSAINGYVYGGWSNSGNSASNSVTISGNSTIYGGVLAGHSSGAATSNSVNISGGTINQNAFGGFSYTGNAASNSVNISGDTTNILGNIYGGVASSTGIAYENKVNIATGTLKIVYGGFSESGNTASNSIDISGDLTKINEVYGGYVKSGTGSASYNILNISSGTLNVAYGGYSNGSGDAANNSVNIIGGDVGCVYGGYVNGSGNVASNSVNISSGTVSYVYGGYSNSGNSASNSVNISGGTINNNVYGGYSSHGAAASNSVTISGGTIYSEVYGGYSYSGNAASNSVNISGGSMTNVLGGYSVTGKAASNTINISNGTVGDATGGYSHSGNAASNSINISGGTINNACGGYSFSGNTTSNSVKISGGTVNGIVFGGSSASGNTTSNSVSISGGTVNGSIYGGDSSDAVASNSVNISGGTFGSESRIYAGFLGKNNYFSKDNSVNLGNSVTGLENTLIFGHYCYFAGTYTHSGNELHIGRAVDYDDEGKIKRDTDGNIIYKSDESTIWQGKNSEGNVNNIVKKVANFETLALHSVAWNSNLPALKATTMEDVDTLDVTDLKLYGTFAINDSMNLLEWGNDGGGVTNLQYKTNSIDDAQTSVLSDTPISVFIENISGTDKGIALEGTSTGDVKKADKAVQYSVNGVTLNSIDLSNWNGETSTITATWNGVTNVPVVTGSFTLPTNVNPGESITILTTANASILDTNITGSNKYGSNIDDSSATTDFTNDTDKGITFEGIYAKGVKASDDNKSLLFAVGTTKYVTDIALGTIAINEIRNMNGADYNFSKVSKIDASSLIISNPEDLNKGTAVNLLSNAANLANNPSLSYGEGKTSHSQEIEVTDNESGVKFMGSMSGSVSTTAETIQYTQAEKFVNKIDLTGWKGTTYDADLSDWTAEDNATIETNNMSTPEEMSPGDTKTIIKDESTNGTYLLSDMEVKGSLKWQDAGEFQDTPEKGVSVTGTTTGGGVKVTDDYKELIYKKSNIAIDKIKLGQVTFDNGGTARTFSNEYKFSDATINASDLTFADSTDLLKSGDSMTLADKAKGITAESSVTDGTDKSINISYSDNTSGITYTAKASGNVSADTNAVKFTIESVAGESINLAKWNGTTAEYPDVWTVNANGVNVAGVFTEPELSAGESKNILTASTAMFKDENIDETIRFAENTSFKDDSANGLTLSGVQTGGVKATDEGKALTYYAMFKDVSEISLGSMKWGEGRTFNSNGAYDFKNITKIDASGLSFTNPEEVNGSMELLYGAKNLETGKAVTGSNHTQKFDSELANKAVVSATLIGEVSVENEKVKFVSDGIIVDKFDLANWDGEKAVSVQTSWMMNDDASIETDGMSNLPDSDEEKQVFILKSDTEGFFANVAINGENAYGKKQNKFTDSDEAERVVLAGIQEKGVTFDSAKTNLVYKFGSKDVTSLKLKTIRWEDGAEILSRDKYNYSKLNSLDTKDFNITYEKPETVEANQSMTLLKANETLADMAAIDKSVSYQYEPLSGVAMDAVIMSRLEAKSGKVTLKTVSNKADKLTFKDIEWLDKGSLIDHKSMLNNVSFDGADVDTTKIAFTNKEEMKANSKMTLVSDFGDSVGTITGSKYKVGTAFEGEGSAYLDGSDLVFKTKTGAGLSDETHTTVMAMEAGTAILAAGSEHIGNAIEGLGYAANTGSDGVSTFASVGGNTGRYETGSHVDTNSWNCTLVVGRNLEKRDGTMEYGVFAEYGRGNYTLHMDGVDNAGSGNTHYTGGGLLMKWTNSHDVYTEASFRMGNMKDNASGILHDGAGNAYGYDTNAKYRGGHFGFGKTYREEDNTKLEIYGKYFYNEREGINFAAAADQYSLDKVRSRVLRAGFRYSTTQRKWNRYGGLAFDHEFGGESRGTVNGTAIRSASVKGGTLRGEFGYCREATKTNPWKTDISLYGFTGKRQGFGGNISVEYHF